MSAFLGDFRVGKTVRKMWNSNAVAGESITRATNGTISVYKDGGTTQSTTGVTDTEDFDGLTGVHLVAVDTSADGTFYSAGSDFEVVLSAATIDSKTINATLFSFSLENRSALMPTTDGRKLDVSAGGEAGVDWANVGSPTTTLNLSGTTVKTATDVETDTADIQTRLPAALVSGRMDSSVGAMAANTLTASALAADAVTEIQSGLSTLDAAGVRTAVGLASANLDTQLTAIDDYLDTEVAAIKAKTDNLPSDPADASDVAASFSTVNTTLGTIAGYLDTEIAAIKAKTDNLPASPAAVSDIPSAATIADTTLARALAAESYAADGGTPTLSQILWMIWAGLVDFSIAGTTLTVKKQDGTTAMTFTLDDATDPTSRTRAT